jgi:acyl carrier protein
MSVSSATAPATLIMRVSLPLSKPYVAPNNEIEALAATTFAEVFNLDKVGIDDEFFELGGDSLLAEVLSLALSERLGSTIRPSSLVEWGSPRQIVSLVEAKSARPEIAQDRPPDHEIERRIRAFTADWKGERRTPGSLILGLNLSGAKRPIFWCFQGGHEFDRLATHLGPDRPLYGMRSGYVAMEQTSANSAALAQRYFEEILRIDDRGPYLLGGNCRGGIEAVEIARKLQQSGRQVLLLTLIDVRLWETLRGAVYPGRIACFVGIYSRFNPFRRFRWPELGWRKLVPQGLKFALLPADHGRYFSDAVLPILVGELRTALEWSEATESPPAKNSQTTCLLSEGSYRARLRLPESLRLECGERRRIGVTVKNSSMVTWPPTTESAIALGNHWLSPQGELLIWSDGRAKLTKPLRPGANQNIQLEVRAPNEPGEYLLEVDLVEEGVTWFKEQGMSAAVLPVTVSSVAEPSGRIARALAACRRRFFA